jgi:hypothetical protein
MESRKMSQLLSPEQASLYLFENGLSVAVITLRKRRTTHPTNPKYRKVGGRIRYTAQDLDAFLAGVDK